MDALSDRTAWMSPPSMYIAIFILVVGWLWFDAGRDNEVRSGIVECDPKVVFDVVFVDDEDFLGSLFLGYLQCCDEYVYVHVMRCNVLRLAC